MLRASVLLLAIVACVGLTPGVAVADAETAKNKLDLAMAIQEKLRLRTMCTDNHVRCACPLHPDLRDRRSPSSMR